MGNQVKRSDLRSIVFCTAMGKGVPDCTTRAISAKLKAFMKGAFRAVKRCIGFGERLDGQLVN